MEKGPRDRGMRQGMSVVTVNKGGIVLPAHGNEPGKADGVPFAEPGDRHAVKEPAGGEVTALSANKNAANSCAVEAEVQKFHLAFTTSEVPAC